ncbi:MAG: TAXI family TRAP transporter solute-binding subunit [Hyphomicrobiaceae bacterium]
MKSRNAGIAGAALLALGLAAAPANAETKLTYFTGPTGGSWIPIGGALKVMWEKAIPGLSIENRPGAGLVNLKAVEEGKAQIGMGNLISTVDALAGKGTGITKPFTNVCHLASLYPNVAQFVVRSDVGIKSIADLKGKAVGTLPRGNTTNDVASWLLDAAGVGFKGTSKMAFASLSDMSNMFKDGQIVASFMVTTQGNGSIKDMANSRKIALLDIPDDIFAKLKAQNAGFQRYTIPKSAYPGLEKDNVTAAFPAHVIVSCKLPDDLVYNMAKAMSDQLSDLINVNASFKGKTVKDLGAPVDVKWHPGAQKYFKEKGAL